MSAQVETIGYRFRISQGSNVFDVISTTDIGITKSNDIIRTFFDNFKILKNEKISKQENAVCDENKGVVNNGNDKTGKNGDDHVAKPARKKRDTMKNIWGNLRDLLSDEFTTAEYAKALRDAGYEYTEGSWEAIPAQQLKKIVKLGKIEKIEGAKPVKYRKIKVPHSFRSDQRIDNTMKSLKDGKKVILDSIK